MPANKVYVVGITGGTGCGKSEAARYLAELGAKHIDADAISRALTAAGGEAIPEIRRQFGDALFDAEGKLNRRALHDLVFSSIAHKRALEGIIHPMVQRRAMDEIQAAAEQGFRVVILDVPLLFETGMDVLCDETWAMSVDEAAQLKRVCERDGLNADQARARIQGQMPMAERNARANRVINSARPIEKTQSELNQLYHQLLRRLG